MKQPEELEQMAIVKIGDWIAHQAEKLMVPISELHEVDAAKAEASLSRYIDIIRSCLDVSVPRIYHDTIANEALRALKKLSKSLKTETHCLHVIKRMIETVFSKNVTSLVLLYDTYPMFQASFCSKSYMLTGLVHLKIDYHANETDFIEFLKELHSLKYLEIRYCTENMIKCVVENCKLIEEITLTLGEWDCHSYSNMILLTQLHNLRRLTQESLIWLDVDGFQIFYSILLLCKNIEHLDLGVNNTKILLEVLKYFASDEDNSSKQFKLKSYSGKSNTLEDLQLVVQMCPQIEKFSMYYGERIFRNNLEPLTDLKHLHELELGGVGFHEHVRGLLEAVGSNLVHLKIDGANDLDLNAMMDISQLCPNLQSLSLGISTPTIHTPLQNRTLEIEPFRNLKTIKFSTFRFGVEIQMFYTRPDFDKQLFFLLSNSLNVEFVEIFSSVQLSEDNISKLLQKNSFTSLKQLKILPNNLTLANSLVDHIIQNGISYPNVTLFGKSMRLESYR